MVLASVLLVLSAYSESVPSVSEAAAAQTAGGTPPAADDADRDRYSRPREVFAFAGVKTGSVVVDVGAGGGYSTFHLAALVGPTGRIFAVGGNAALEKRLATGDMAGIDNVEILGKATDVPDGTADVVLLIREFHLAPDHPAYIANVRRMLKPGGQVALVEVRSGTREGYDHKTHRSGEQTVINEFVAGGFELVAESNLLRRDGDDYTAYAPAGKRYMTDRMLLLFRSGG